MCGFVQHWGDLSEQMSGLIAHMLHGRLSGGVRVQLLKSSFESSINQTYLEFLFQENTHI